MSRIPATAPGTPSDSPTAAISPASPASPASQPSQPSPVSPAGVRPVARSGPAALGAPLLLVTLAWGFVIRTDPARPPFQALDERWLRWMGGPHEGVYAAAADALNRFGGPPGVLVPVGLLLFLAFRRRWVSAAYLLAAYFGGSLLVVQALKRLVDRPRPANPLVQVDHGSFPSGHAATAALLVVAAGVLLVPTARRRRVWWAAGAVFTLAMMWSRTWLHAHWLSDTAAGAAAGAGAALLTWAAFRPALARERERRTASAGVQAAAGD